MRIIKIKDKTYEIEYYGCSKNKETFPFYINITNQCNAKCPFCSNAWNTSNKELDLVELKEILEEIKNDITRFAISGGETLINTNKMDQLLTLLNPYNKKITINTNGFFLKENVKMLNQYENIESIQLSRHHYDDEKNNEIFKIKTIPLKELIFLPLKPELRMNCLLIKGYIDSKEEVINFLEEISKKTNITNVGFISMMQVNEYAKDNFVYYKDIVKEIEKGPMRISHNKEFYYEDNLYKKSSLKDKDRCSCDNYLYISKNGKIIDIYFRYTKQYGSGKRSLFYDCNGLKEGY